MAHRILLVDDNADFRRSVATILGEAGYTVSEAATGKEAFAQLKFLAQFDLLITDLAMPDMNGLQLLTEVRRLDPGLPVIAMSGSFSGRLLQFAASFGVPTLEKPFKRADLLRLVESTLVQTVVTK